jgi:hypothetical protein
MHSRRPTSPPGITLFQPDQSEGEDDNALMWPTDRWSVLDAYALRLSEGGWQTVRGGRAPRRVAPFVLAQDPGTGARHAFASVHLPPSIETPAGPNSDAPTRVAVAAEALQSIGNHAHFLHRSGFAVHVGGDWNVDALRDDGEHDGWPEAALGDLLRSAWRARGAGDDPGTFGEAGRMVDDWRTTSAVASVRSLHHVPSDHRLVVARLRSGA